MWALAADAGLDVNSPYAYVLWADHHHETTFVAEHEGGVVGFVLGYLIPSRQRELFIWQIAVAPPARGTGLAGLLLDTVRGSVDPLAVEATVTPSNRASANLFRSFARRHGADLATAEGYPAALFPHDHEPEERYRIELGRNRPSHRAS